MIVIARSPLHYMVLLDVNTSKGFWGCVAGVEGGESPWVVAAKACFWTLSLTQLGYLLEYRNLQCDRSQEVELLKTLIMDILPKLTEEQLLKILELRLIVTNLEDLLYTKSFIYG